jgi:NAD(P)-dependent dehydrogenase (short-subunit alcohol dehydrogenase family)
MKTLLITGASSGIGKATAIAAAEAGWHVVACGRNRERLDELAAHHEAIDVRAFDLTDPQACLANLSNLSPDVTILNAGACEYVDVDRWEPALFRRVFDANFFSVINTLHALLPSLKVGSQLLFVDSLARLLPFTRSEAYGASKAALFYLTKSLEVDLRDRGIVVQSVSPGFVRTPLTDKNSFAMPMRMEVEDAAQAILQLVGTKAATSYFPMIFASILRVLGSLPVSMQTALCRYLARKEAGAV